MLKEKHLKLCCEPKPNELETIKIGGWGRESVWRGGGCVLSHTFTRGKPGSCPSLRNKAVNPSNLNTSHSRRLRARREGRAENKPLAFS